MADAPRQPSLMTGASANEAAVGTPAGLVPRVLQSWSAPRRVVLGLRDMPERGLIVVLLLALLMILVGQAPVNARAAHLDPSVPMGARMGGSIMAVIFLMPLIAYGLAALVSALSRLTRRPVAPRHSRLALFWALLAVSPAMLLSGLVAGLVGEGPALMVTRGITGIAFLLIWGAGLAALAQE